MGTRIIESENERKLTAILTPFVPCSAKLPIIALFSGFFFKENAGVISASLYFLAVIIIIISAYIISRFVLRSSSNSYISELPEYKKPDMQYIINDVVEKIVEFARRAGTVILICSIVIWFLLSFTMELQYTTNIENSVLAHIGKKISWIFIPMLGTNSWETAVSSIQGLIAKEQVISSMAVISGLEGGIGEESQIFSGGAFNYFTGASAYAFMVFNLFSAPCFGAIGAMKKELGSTRKVLKVVTFQIVLAWLLSVGIYQFMMSF